MKKDNHYDVAIIGSGVAGISAALTASKKGLSVCLIEKDKQVGGMSYHYGCVPGKTILSAANLYDQIKLAESFGIRGIDQSKVIPDWGLLMRRVQDNSKRSAKGVAIQLDKNNVVIIKGEAKVISKTELMVNNLAIGFDHLVIATGSIYGVPEYLKNASSNFHIPRSIYSIKEIPNSITIVGAGVIGIEFASMFASLGSEVHLVERSKKLMPYMDDELVNTLTVMLKEKNITLHTGWTASEFDNGNLIIKNDNETDILKTDQYLSCISRQPNLNGLDVLLKQGLELTKGGFINTDLQTRTTLSNVYAVGDINGRFMLAHVASHEGEICAKTISDEKIELIYDFMPYNMYTSPEFASVGLTEKKAKEQGFIVRTKIYPLSSNIKVLTEGHPEGFVKVVTNEDKTEILGVHIVGHNATDMISEATLQMMLGGSVDDFKKVVHPHPSMNEALVEAFK